MSAFRSLPTKLGPDACLALPAPTEQDAIEVCQREIFPPPSVAAIKEAWAQADGNLKAAVRRLARRAERSPAADDRLSHLSPVQRLILHAISACSPGARRADILKHLADGCPRHAAHNIAYSTVHEVLHELEAAGLVATRHEAAQFEAAVYESCLSPAQAMTL